MLKGDVLKIKSLKARLSFFGEEVIFRVKGFIEGLNDLGSS